MPKYCLDCGNELSESDLREDSKEPELGWRYYVCPACDYKMRYDGGNYANRARAAVTPEVLAEREPDAVAPPEPVTDDAEDLQQKLMALTKELDDGDGADRSELIIVAVKQLEVTPDAVETLIHDCLMSGYCYEPGENKLKAI